jgi:hypothetical protein
MATVIKIHKIHFMDELGVHINTVHLQNGSTNVFINLKKIQYKDNKDKEVL